MQCNWDDVEEWQDCTEPVCTKLAGNRIFEFSSESPHAYTEPAKKSARLLSACILGMKTGLKMLILAV
jgi:hypothetical protein